MVLPKLFIRKEYNMSYGCDVSFKKLNSFTEMNEFISALKEKARDPKVVAGIINDNKYYILLNRPHSSCYVKGELTDELKMDLCNNMELEYWISRLFTFRWCYIDYIDSYEVGYLALFGVPKQLRSEFDGTVYFQNSTDQDYDKSEWSGLEAFEQIYDSWFEVPPEEAYRYYHYDVEEEDVKNFIESEDYDYERKSAAYKMISEPIVDRLYDNNGSYISLFRKFDDIMDLNKYKKEIIDNGVLE